MRQQTPAELVAQIVQADGRSLNRIEKHAGIYAGSLRTWMRGEQCPGTASLIALANACGAEIVAKRKDA